MGAFYTVLLADVSAIKIDLTHSIGFVCFYDPGVDFVNSPRHIDPKTDSDESLLDFYKRLASDYFYSTYIYSIRRITTFCKIIRTL